MSTNASPGQSPFDLATPYRPGTNDFNGNAKTDATPEPDPVSMPNAPEWTELCALAVAYGRVIPAAKVSVKYVTGSPALDSFASAGSNVVSGTFTIGRTGGGAANGDITITWPANTFPPQSVQPVARLNGTTPGGICCSAVANGVRVVAVNMSNAATDLPFTVDVT